MQKKKNHVIEPSTKASDIKRDRFYGTIHKPSSMQINDKIPGKFLSIFFEKFEYFN